MSRPSRIALVGFMGSGKTTVGRRLALRLGYRFEDSDVLVETKAGMKVREIFATRGETAFRDLERAAIREILESEAVVMATGGGAFIEPETAALIAQRAFVVYLECDFTEALRRAEKSGGRPLLDNGEDAAAALFAARKEKYSRAQATVSTTRRAPVDVVAEIVRSLTSA